jgi:predicted permease
MTIVSLLFVDDEAGCAPESLQPFAPKQSASKITAHVGTENDRDAVDGGNLSLCCLRIVVALMQSRILQIYKVVKCQQCREESRMREPGFLSALRQDLRFAARMVAKCPGFSAAIVLTIALGIGANTALFSVIRAVLLRPLGYGDPQKLVVLTRGATPIHVDEFRAAARSYSETGVFSGGAEQMALTGQGEPEVVSAARVSANFLSILGVPPALGRSFLPSEDRAGTPNVAMISTRLWRQHFAGDPAVLGHIANLAGTPYTIIGVLPPRFAFPFAGANTDVWITRPIEWSLMPVKSRPLSPYLHIFGRLKPDVSLDQANAELVTLNRQYAAAHPAMLDAKPSTADNPTRVSTLQESIVADVRLPLLLLSGAVGLLLLIVCANVASLLLARAATRAREFAVRSAVGAGRGRLLRQLLTESTLLSVLGGAPGILLAWAALRGIRTVTALELPRSSEIRLDLGVLGFALSLSLITGILFGLAPALSAFRRDLAAVLQGNLASSSARGRLRRHLAAGPRGLLVAGQVALSLILLVSAGLLLQSLAHLYNVDPGFRADRVLTMSISLGPAQYDTDAKRASFYTRLVERVEAIPGVQHASVTLTLPTTGWAGAPVRITGRPELLLNQRPIAIIQQISPNYFRTLQIPLNRGRAFTIGDKAGAPGVTIIDESLARRFWPQYPRGESPIGEHLLVGSSTQPLEIVGIVAPVHQEGRDTDPMPGFYVPNAQQPPQAAILVLRTKSDPRAFADTVRRQILTLDRNQPVSDIKTLSAVLDTSEDQRRLMFALLGGFSLAATLLAVLGLYSVISYSVVERTREIAIRQALGAQRHSILGLVLRQGLAVALAGIVFGTAGAAGVTRLLNSMLFGVKAIDLVTFTSAAALFLIVALAATYVPARRAAAVEPMAALRDN